MVLASETLDRISVDQDSPSDAARGNLTTRNEVIDAADRQREQLCGFPFGVEKLWLRFHGLHLRNNSHWRTDKVPIQYIRHFLFVNTNRNTLSLHRIMESESGRLTFNLMEFVG